ncbi:hypothetical protein HHK36_025320 [Tetracentron sinense]|uniref:Uncharacterized protein n=1 Tax=Tetracentron sinense TaxID=13715 RepID=A0A834YLX6_TETSI|nr:hypothetical protein HHK36_025320 [Tetracentron sinense]
MASSIPGGENKEQQNGHRMMKRACSSSNNDAMGGHGSKACVCVCVCAPPTHAGSFKCRLHRVNSQSHSTQSAPPQPTVPSSSTRCGRYRTCGGHTLVNGAIDLDVDVTAHHLVGLETASSFFLKGRDSTSLVLERRP